LELERALSRKDTKEADEQVSSHSRALRCKLSAVLHAVLIVHLCYLEH
jgi:hypothetical protein